MKSIEQIVAQTTADARSRRWTGASLLPMGLTAKGITVSAFGRPAFADDAAAADVASALSGSPG